MQCLQCQHENVSDTKFSNQRATPFVPQCAFCGCEHAVDAKFCNQCGTRIIAPTSAPGSVQSMHQEVESESRFQALIRAVMGMLQRERRVTYRTLKYVFSLDDGFLEEVKEELVLIGGACDEDGKVLVWTGETQLSVPSAVAIPSQPAVPEGDTVTSAPTPTLPLGVTETHIPSNGPATVPEVISIDVPSDESMTVPEPPRSVPDAERRQLTVMFCDLVGSTDLSGKLDPEDLRDVIRAYQETAAGVIQRYEGHIAQYLGDGLLVYFGWPQAHDDDAQRGAHTGLGIVEAMETLNARLDQDKGVRLAVRIGMHTGPVVIGEMGGGGRHEQLALGETTNIASRLEGLAAPNAVVISDTTYQLVDGYFNCDDLGTHTLKGVATPMQTYRVLHETETHTRFEVATTRGLTPLMGREDEVALLQRRWEQSRNGHGQVVLLSGEGGIGKSRLVEVLREQAEQAGSPWMVFRCSPYHTNSVLYPVIDHVQRRLRLQPNDTPEVKLDKLEQMLQLHRCVLEETVPLFAALLTVPLPDRYPALNMTPQRQRQQTLAALVTWLLPETTRQSVLLVVEDLHWADPSTLEVLSLLFEQIAAVPMLTLLTFRPEFHPSWAMAAHLTRLTLNRFTPEQVERMATHMAGDKSLPDAVIRQVVTQTDGVPLFVEEMTKAVLEAGVVQDVDGQYEVTGSLSALAIPATLQDWLMSRLDRLRTAKGIAQLGATIGRQFSYALLHAVSQLDDATLQRELGHLIDAELVYQRGAPPQATYTFKHALITDAAYASLLKRTRQQYHQRIAQVSSAQFPEMAETQPELLAHHFTEAGLNEQAIPYWQQGGENALQRSAYVEAMAHLRQGLALLTALPETPARLQQELDLQIALGPALYATKGQAAPDVERAYARARELCQQIGDTPQLFPALRGLVLYYNSRGQLQTAYQLGEQLLSLAQSQHEPALLMLAHCMMGTVVFYRGEPASAHTHHAQALAIYIPQDHRNLALRYGTDLGVLSHCWLTWDLWQLGYPDQAMQHSQAARTLAQEVSHPHSLATALVWSAVLHQFRREAPAAHEQAEAGTTLATEQGFAHWLAWGTVPRGWALAMQGQGEVGIAEMRQGLAAYLATGATVSQPYFLGLLAEAYGEGGRPEEGLLLLAEAVAVMDTTEARFYGVELYRLKGALLLRQAVPDASQAEFCFHQALSIARTQHAKSWELRAATSLARLWQSQDKRQDATDLLAPVYEWFTEGFDTTDLKDAKALLDELS